MLSLTEYATTTVQLDPAEAGELAAMARGSRTGDRPRVIERLTPAATPGTYEIQPGPYTGRFMLRSGLVVDIGCRFAFHDLATLLGLGRRTTLLEDVTAPAAAGHGLLDLVALAFVRQAERVAGQGLAKAYQRRSFTRPPYPGVPAPAVHLRAHAGRPDRLATVANRLTTDVPLNRLVAAALHRLGALAYQDGDLTVRVRALAPIFRGIPPLTGPAPEAGVVPARYRRLYDLARLVLDDRTTLPTGTELPGPGVLFNMPKVWESHVEQWLRARTPDGHVSAQHGIPLTDSGRSLTARADFVVFRHGRPVAVYDAKYRPWRTSPSTDEVFQLFTYAQRLGVASAALVHPSADERHETMTVGDVRIDTWGVPVRGPAP